MPSEESKEGASHSFDKKVILDSSIRRLVEPWGIEPQTSSMPLRRSTN